MGCLLDNVLRVLLTLLSSPVVVLLKHSWILLGWAPRWSFDIDEMQPLMSGSHLFSKRPFLCWTFALFWKPELGSPFYLDISKGGRDRPTKILYFPPSLFLSGEMLVEVVEAKVSYRKEWGVYPPPLSGEHLDLPRGILSAADFEVDLVYHFVLLHNSVSRGCMVLFCLSSALTVTADRERMTGLKCLPSALCFPHGVSNQGHLRWAGRLNWRSSIPVSPTQAPEFQISWVEVICNCVMCN